ncbi:uncharacterized protein FIBRA_07526 [Fibroporia radiculosa]|uniref:PEBP-like protein n=1 Tax=Fibroporia radiculosa TaxID=599839 RepID=J4I0U3_9APHY|nr:uncharacterized protein FIBRA_07526 [Fibroporia radiculosa]CCM05312.1 predicted protein [Fibroporia radiculosa]
MAHLDPLTSLVAALKRDHIIPDVLPESFNPSVLLDVVFPNGKEVLLGNELSKEDVMDEPAINYVPMNMPFEQAEATGESASEEIAYTLVMLDPDMPSKADVKFRCFAHWIIMGLKSPAHSASRTSDPSALKTHVSTTSYMPPEPLPGSGIHRYTFLLYQELLSSELPQDAMVHHDTVKERQEWDPVSFGDKNGRKLVGATYFLIAAPEQ